VTVELDDTSFASAAGTGIAVVDLWADWCGPCKQLAPAFAEVADTWNGPEATFAKVDVDASPGLVTAFAVMSIPTIVVLRDGEVIGRLVGSRPAQRLREELHEIIDSA
jgi:thioredoxin